MILLFGSSLQYRSALVVARMRSFFFLMFHRLNGLTQIFSPDRSGVLSHADCADDAVFLITPTDT